MDLLSTLTATLLYPGLLTAVVLGLAFAAITRGWLPAGPGLAGALGSREGLCAAGAILFAGLGLSALPWPPRAGGGGAGWLWAWAGFEAAFLLPLAPALLSGAPRVVRAAIREAQIGALARALLWGALAVALARHADWSLAALPAHLLAGAAALALFPAAIGWGPFAEERGVTGDGTMAGLAPPARALLALAADVRGGALLGAVAVAVLPVGAGAAWLGLAVAAGGFLVAALLLRRLGGRLPRLPLPAAVRLGLLAGAPLVAAAALALALAQ